MKFVKIIDKMFSRLKRRQTIQFVPKPASLMVWGCISAYGTGNLNIWKGSINAEMYKQVLEQHLLPSR